MAENPPEWLDADFFEKALRPNRKDPNLKILSCEVGRATQPGDNFGSEMYRANLKIEANHEIEDTSVIIKCRIRGSELMNTPITSDAFITEAKIYSEIHTLMKKEALAKTIQPFAAKCFFTNTDTWREAIMLEDLKKEGFRLAEVSVGLDLEHCMLVMRTIAQYHAASLVLREKILKCLEPFKESLFIKYPDSVMAQFLATSVRNLAQEVVNWPGYEIYQDALKSLEPTANNHLMDALRIDETGLNVLLHGDLWLNNMMFRYSEETGNVQDVRFVDFQLSCVSSPAVDLQYFLNSSASPQVLENNLDKLLQEYHTTLCNTLAHHCLHPTNGVIKSEFHKRGLYGALCGLSIRSVVLCDKSHIPDFDDIVVKQGNVYLSDTFKTAMKKLLPLYRTWEWLNV
ncbi:hypothetical protein L9F63_023770 [Diploptera punctata]|uniref:CHK kinase-like domain-containing protein n=1 Tax=Diploptera punctata TaxID=6984 RepID=A0AAD7ZIF1_DIPPU|nr:hypothetical protein L9F63_023770 [Diploptera punctata]